MDINRLTQQDRLLIWERLHDSPDWGLVSHCLKLQKKKVPDIVDLNSREAFLYAAIRNQVIDELINLPETQMEAIYRSNQ